MRAMKKIVLLFAVILAVGQIPVIALAHGADKGHRHGTNDTICGLCNVAGCNATEVHQHRGKNYYGHSMDDGHDYHTVCNIEGCTEITKHEHESNTISSNGNGHHNSNRNHGGHHH